MICRPSASQLTRKMYAHPAAEGGFIRFNQRGPCSDTAVISLSGPMQDSQSIINQCECIGNTLVSRTTLREILKMTVNDCHIHKVYYFLPSGLFFHLLLCHSAIICNIFFAALPCSDCITAAEDTAQCIYLECLKKLCIPCESLCVSAKYNLMPTVIILYLKSLAYHVHRGGSLLSQIVDNHLNGAAGPTLMHFCGGS